MKQYDPLNAPNPDAWLALDESLKMGLVAAHHKAARERLPRPELHAAFHVIVENQLAMRLPAVESAYKRMMAEGLNRHEAIHAICSVLAGHFQNLVNRSVTEADPNQAYYRELEQLTAEQWRASGLTRAERKNLEQRLRRLRK